MGSFFVLLGSRDSVVCSVVSDSYRVGKRTVGTTVDLTLGAAKKPGFYRQGTARVLVEAVS